MDAEVPGGTALLRQQASEYYRKLQSDAKEAARQEGIALTTELVEGDEVEAIVECGQRAHSDLLVLGVHRQSLLLSRLWPEQRQTSRQGCPSPRREKKLSAGLILKRL